VGIEKENGNTASQLTSPDSDCSPDSAERERLTSRLLSL